MALLSAAPCRADGIGLSTKWSGGYIGAQTGGIWSDLQGSKAAWSKGGHAGYGLQFGMLVVGVEGDATWGGSQSSTLYSPIIYWNNQTNWTGSVRGRLGVAFDNLHLYATGGAAYIDQTTSVNRLGQGLQSTTSSTPGTVIGAGIEYRFLPGIVGHIEALHYDYSIASQSWAAAPTKSLPAFSTPELSAQDTVVRVGVSLRFN